MLLGFNNMNMFNMFNMFPMGNMCGFGGFGTSYNYGFGGFDMGNFGGFGSCCGNSIFGDRAAGFAVGSVLAQIGTAALGQHLQEKQANSKQTLQANVDTYNKQIKTECKKLGCTTSEEALNFTVEEKYTTDITTAEGKKNEADANITKYKGEFEGLNTTLNNLKTELKTLETATPKDDTKIAEKKQEVEAQQELVDAKKAEITAEENNSKSAEAEVKKATDAKDAREKEIKNIQKNIKDLVEKRDEIQEEINDKTLDKADGSRYQQSKKENFEMKFEGFGTENERLINKTVEKKDIRYIIQNYRDAQTPEEKSKWKTRFNTLYNELETKDRTKEFKEASKIING